MAGAAAGVARVDGGRGVLLPASCAERQAARARAHASVRRSEMGHELWQGLPVQGAPRAQRGWRRRIMAAPLVEPRKRMVTRVICILFSRTMNKLHLQ